MDAADFKTLLFSFRGRTNRAKWWLSLLIYTIIMFLFLGLTYMTIPGDGLGAAAVLSIAVGLFFLISSIAVGIKRLHDRDKSGWWLLLFYLVPGIVSGVGEAMGESPVALLLALITLAIYIWMFVELGCLRGTVGPNKYGPDPLESDETQPAAAA